MTDEITHTVTLNEWVNDELTFTRQYGFTSRDDAWSFFIQEEECIIGEFHVMPYHINGQLFTVKTADFTRTVELEDIALEASKQRYEDSLKESGLDVDFD